MHRTSLNVQKHLYSKLITPRDKVISSSLGGITKLVTFSRCSRRVTARHAVWPIKSPIMVLSLSKTSSFRWCKEFTIIMAITSINCNNTTQPRLTIHSFKITLMSSVSQQLFKEHLVLTTTISKTSSAATITLLFCKIMIKRRSWVNKSKPEDRKP